MAESFDIFQFAGHLRARLPFIGLTCGVALALSAAIGLLQPKMYTATSRVVIDPPAGSDARTVMAVSPIYLESLKSYVLFASGDNLFLQAANTFHLRDSRHPIPIESLKRSVLKVSIPQNTKVIEIFCTLPDPRKAQALAGYLAEQTVKLSTRLSLETDRELAGEAEKNVNEARTQLYRAEDESRRISAAGRGTARDRVSAEQAAVEAAEAHLSEVRASAGYRGERLKIIDPGIVPESPTSPNIPLNLAAAFLIALSGSLAWAAAEFTWRRGRPARPKALRLAALGRND